MRGVYWIPKQEDLITEWENTCVLSAFSQGFSVILDATNLDVNVNKAKIALYREALIAKGITEELKVSYKKFLDISPEECVRRDLLRKNSAGEKVIWSFYNRYLAPLPVIYDEDPSLPHCVIFDVDGTLALRGDRGSFDFSKVKDDLPNKPVIQIAQALTVPIIIFTGRDDICEIDTKDWLHGQKVPFIDMFIRETVNNEKDSIVKKRMFEENIRGKYYVDFVVDDRQQVVDMWRKELGLTCIQVNYGDF
jgi:hypothetical protein